MSDYLSRISGSSSSKKKAKPEPPAAANGEGEKAISGGKAKPGGEVDSVRGKSDQMAHAHRVQFVVKLNLSHPELVMPSSDSGDSLVLCPEDLEVNARQSATGWEQINMVNLHPCISNALSPLTPLPRVGPPCR